MSVDHEPDGEAVLANNRGEEKIRGADGNYQEGGRQRDKGGLAIDSSENVRPPPLTPAPDPLRNASDNRCKILESHAHLSITEKEREEGKERRGEMGRRGEGEKGRREEVRKGECWKRGTGGAWRGLSAL